MDWSPDALCAVNSQSVSPAMVTAIINIGVVGVLAERNVHYAYLSLYD